MMRPFNVVFALLSVPSALFAQSTANSVILVQTPQSQNCPVGIDARHSSQGAVEQVRRSGIPSQGYRIALRAFNTNLIRQASVTLHGLSGSQVMPVSMHNEDDAVETFTITPGAKPKAAFHSVVYTRQLTGVRWVELNDVNYADGTQWHQKTGSVCRVNLNGYLLVNASN
jgi:hypothetical protein